MFSRIEIEIDCVVESSKVKSCSGILVSSILVKFTDFGYLRVENLIENRMS